MFAISSNLLNLFYNKHTHEKTLDQNHKEIKPYPKDWATYCGAARSVARMELVRTLYRQTKIYDTSTRHVGTTVRI